MINKRLDRAVRRLITDDRLLFRFRRKPAKALAKFRLSDDEIQAVTAGEMRSLLELGLDKRIAFPRPISRPLWASILVRSGTKIAPAAFVALALTLVGGPVASADDPAAARRARGAGLRRMNPRAAQHRLRALRVQRARFQRTLGKLRRLEGGRARLAQISLRGRVASVDQAIKTIIDSGQN